MRFLLTLRCIEASSVYLFNRTLSLQNQMHDVCRGSCMTNNVRSVCSYLGVGVAYFTSNKNVTLCGTNLSGLGPHSTLLLLLEQ